MKIKIILFSLLTLFNLKVHANLEKCQMASVFNLVVFASEDLNAKNFLSEGSLASGRYIDLVNSNIISTECRALTTPGQISLIESKILGSVEGLSRLKIQSTIISGSARSNKRMELEESSVSLMVNPIGANIYRSDVKTWQKSSVISSMDIEKFKDEIIIESINLRSLADSNAKKIIYKDALTISLMQEKNVLNLSSDQLVSIKRLEIRGDKNQKLIINVSGQSASLDDLLIDISGDIKPGNIVWNFHQATSLKIENTIDQILGIPGRILAPNATVKIIHALITGGVYAKLININIKDSVGISQIKK